MLGLFAQQMPWSNLLSNDDASGKASGFMDTSIDIDRDGAPFCIGFDGPTEVLSVGADVGGEPWCGSRFVRFAHVSPLELP